MIARREAVARLARTMRPFIDSVGDFPSRRGEDHLGEGASNMPRRARIQVSESVVHVGERSTW